MIRALVILIVSAISSCTVPSSTDSDVDVSGPLHIVYANIKSVNGSYLKAYEAAIVAARTQFRFTDYEREIVRYNVTFAESERNYKGSYVVSFELLKSSSQVAPDCRHPQIPTDFYVRRSDFKVIGFGGPDFVSCR